MNNSSSLKKDNCDTKESKVYRLLMQCIEETTRKHTISEERLLKQYIQTGDPRAVEFGMQKFNPDNAGRMAKNQFTNLVYLAVVSITLTTRYCIDGGLDENRAYALSDICLQRLEYCTSEQEIYTLIKDKFELFTSEMARRRSKNVSEKYSKYVKYVVDHIVNNLDKPLSINKISKNMGLSPDYVARLFHNETGMAFSQFIRQQKVEAAKELLEYTDYSGAEISTQLNFCSQSYFIKVFTEDTGMTPKAYRKLVQANIDDSLIKY